MWSRATSSHSYTLMMNNPLGFFLDSYLTLSSPLEGLFLLFFPFLLQKKRLGPYPTIKIPFFFHFWPQKRLLNSYFSPFFNVHELASKKGIFQKRKRIQALSWEWHTGWGILSERCHSCMPCLTPLLTYKRSPSPPHFPSIFGVALLVSSLVNPPCTLVLVSLCLV